MIWMETVKIIHINFGPYRQEPANRYKKVMILLYTGSFTCSCESSQRVTDRSRANFKYMPDPRNKSHLQANISKFLQEKRFCSGKCIFPGLRCELISQLTIQCKYGSILPHIYWGAIARCLYMVRKCVGTVWSRSGRAVGVFYIDDLFGWK